MNTSLSRTSDITLSGDDLQFFFSQGFFRTNPDGGGRLGLRVGVSGTLNPKP